MDPRSTSLRFLVAASLLLAPVDLIAAQSPQTREKTHLEDVERQIFDIVNAERVRAGLNSLREEPVLVEIAADHTRDMLERDFFDHMSPDGVGSAERVGRNHRTLIGEVSENIWTKISSGETSSPNLAEEVMEGLMNSPGHRHNILTPGLTHMGIGVYSSSGLTVLTSEFMVTQLFAAVRGYVESPVPESFLFSENVRFRIRDLDDASSEARYYDLWSVEEQRPMIPPTRIDRAKMRVPRGTYQLRFLYKSLEEGQLDAISAPYVTIR